MLNRRNYYRILHVQPDAHCEIIKASYRTLMQKLKQHPDLGGDDWNASILNEAYRTLTNLEKRAAYDQQFLHRHKSADRQSRQQHADRKKQKKTSTGEYAPTQDKWHSMPVLQNTETRSVSLQQLR